MIRNQNASPVRIALSKSDNHGLLKSTHLNDQDHEKLGAVSAWRSLYHHIFTNALTTWQLNGDQSPKTNREITLLGMISLFHSLWSPAA